MSSLNVKKKFSADSDRVKCVDLHPGEPWILVSLYNGHVYIYNYQSKSLAKQFEVSDLPVRAAKFIARKQWIIVGADDNHLRVYNYNTMDTVKKWEGHTDYVRSIAVHPSLPYILSTSDDMSIKLWDWDQGWANTQIFEGHTHYVMMVAFNPKDPNTFASASLDRTIKVWGLGSSSPHFTLEGHDKGVNCVDYFAGGDKPYLISGADDCNVKVWDYQNKTCVSTLEGHSNNVSSVLFHPELPLIISGSEDGSVRLWNINTYRLEKSLSYNWERVWTIGYQKGSNHIAVGYDNGTILIKLGREEPAVSMDQNGKIIWTKNNEVVSCNVNSALKENVPDGERLALVPKDLGTCDVFPQRLEHGSKGRFVVAYGDGEFIIYTAVAWRNKTYGSAVEFVWSNLNNKGEYAVRDNAGNIRVYNNFTERHSFRPNFSVDGIFGGTLLGVKSSTFVCMYDWKECRLIRKIDVAPKAVFWSDNGEFSTIACESSFYVLKYHKDLVAKCLATGAVAEDGITDAFEAIDEILEKIRTATWVGDCFIYTNAANRLNYCVGNRIETISHLDRHMYLLGYLPRFNRIFLIDKAHNVVTYTLHLSIINYQTAVLRGDWEAARKILPKIPTTSRTKIAQFLEAQGFLKTALEVSQDPDHKFELAVKLEDLDSALTIAKEAGSEQKWKQLGDLAINSSKFSLAEECLKNAEDVSGLLLLYTAQGNAEGMNYLVDLALKKGKNNVAFTCLFLLGELEKCLDLLCNTGRVPEAALFARAYLPSKVSKIVETWRKELQPINPTLAESLADPMEYANLFPDIKYALQAEASRKDFKYTKYSASSYPEFQHELNRNIIQEVQTEPEYSDTEDNNFEPPVISQPSTQKVVETSSISSPPSVEKTVHSPPPTHNVSENNQPQRSVTNERIHTSQPAEEELKSKHNVKEKPISPSSNQVTPEPTIQQNFSPPPSPQTQKNEAEVKVDNKSEDIKVAKKEDVSLLTKATPLETTNKDEDVSDEFEDITGIDDLEDLGEFDDLDDSVELES
eukprot:TRINITY_DN1226_c0_g1_i1.p1 TRINITY_DN1226_c0_g1~~TRINITY_DN1226_c0_g1_i1.p1  ORF type:complete len:1025 (-),score=223.71 TRINITY_DN1226_c0_g1_i1:90-3164(-)